MSLMSMRRKMASKRTIQYIVGLLILVFVASIGLMVFSNGPIGNSPTGSTAGRPAPGGEVVATAGKQQLTANEFNELFYREYNKSSSTVDPNGILELRKNIYQKETTRMVMEQVFADKKIKLGWGELPKMAKELADQSVADMRKEAEKQAKTEQETATKAATEKKDPSKPETEPRTADEIMAQQMGMMMMQSGGDPTAVQQPTEAQFRKWFVNDFLLGKGENGVYTQFEQYAKLRKLGRNEIKLTMAEVNTDAMLEKLGKKEVKASWIFIKADAKTADGVKKAEESAAKLVTEIGTDAKVFAAKAKAQSDDMMTSSLGGDLNYVKDDQQYFPATALYQVFTTEKGKVSPAFPVVHSSFMGTDLGYAIVMVTDIKDRTDDAAKEYNPATYKTKFIGDFEAKMGQEIVERERVNIAVTAKTSELQAYQAEIDMDFAKDINGLYVSALQTGKEMPSTVVAALNYKIAKTVTNPKERIAYLTNAMPVANTQALQHELHLDLAKAYAADKQNAKALEQLDNAALSAGEDFTAHESLKTEYTKLGAKDKAAEMAKWMKEHPKSKTPATPNMGNFTMPPMQ